MDFAIVNVALPSIQRSLSFSDADLAWVTSGYALTFGGFLLLAGRVGDVAGRRRTFLAGIVVFTVASAVCGLAVDPAMLLAGRGLQGAGAAFTAASTLALIATAFAPGRERSRALALWGAMGGLGAGCGVVVGGALTELAGWQSIFLLNIPVGIAIAVGAVLCLPADRPEGAGRLAIVQAIAVTGGVGVLMLALSEAESDPAAPATIGRFALAALLLGTFAVAERLSPTRLLPLGRDPPLRARERRRARRRHAHGRVLLPVPLPAAGPRPVAAHRRPRVRGRAGRDGGRVDGGGPPRRGGCSRTSPSRSAAC